MVPGTTVVLGAVVGAVVGAVDGAVVVGSLKEPTPWFPLLTASWPLATAFSVSVWIFGAVASAAEHPMSATAANALRYSAGRGNAERRSRQGNRVRNDTRRSCHGRSTSW